MALRSFMEGGEVINSYGASGLCPSFFLCSLGKTHVFNYEVDNITCVCNRLIIYLVALPKSAKRRCNLSR